MKIDLGGDTQLRILNTEVIGNSWNASIILIYSTSDGEYHTHTQHVSLPINDGIVEIPVEGMTHHLYLPIAGVTTIMRPRRRAEVIIRRY